MIPKNKYIFVILIRASLQSGICSEPIIQDYLLTCIIHASSFGEMQGVESRRRSRLLRGFRNAADAQKLAHAKKWIKIYIFEHIK